jgi:hypothetical protein
MARPTVTGTRSPQAMPSEGSIVSGDVAQFILSRMHAEWASIASMATPATGSTA